MILNLIESYRLFKLNSLTKLLFVSNSGFVDGGIDLIRLSRERREFKHSSQFLPMRVISECKRLAILGRSSYRFQLILIVC